MRTLNHVETTGIIYRKSDNAFLGSCFVFRYPNTIMTALHCLHAVEATDLHVQFPGSKTSGFFDVLSINTHATADVAIARISEIDERLITWPLYLVFDDRAYGTPISAYGYPQEIMGETVAPTPRYFSGYIQRYFEHESHLGFIYTAAELSFSAPRGLSGAAVINPHNPGRLYGVITENLRTTTEQESYREVQEGGKEYKETFHSVINYGIAAWLPSIDHWIDSIVPPVPQDELHRRTINQHKWS